MSVAAVRLTCGHGRSWRRPFIPAQAQAASLAWPGRLGQSEPSRRKASSALCRASNPSQQRTAHQDPEPAVIGGPQKHRQVGIHPVVEVGLPVGTWKGRKMGLGPSRGCKAALWIHEPTEQPTSQSRDLNSLDAGACPAGAWLMCGRVRPPTRTDMPLACHDPSGAASPPLP